MNSKLSFFSGKVFLYNLERALPPGVDSYRPRTNPELIFFFKPEMRKEAIRIINRYTSSISDEDLDRNYDLMMEKGVTVQSATDHPSTVLDFKEDTGLDIKLYDDGTYEIDGYRHNYGWSKRKQHERQTRSRDQEDGEAADQTGKVSD